MEEAESAARLPLGELWEAEHLLWQAFGRGQRVDLRVGDAILDDPRNGDDWPESRHVRAEVVAALLLGAVPPSAGSVPGVSLMGALIVGDLDVRRGVIECFVALKECRFSGQFVFSEAETRSIDLSGSSFDLLDGSVANVKGNLLMDQCRADYIMLYDAHIRGRWSLNGAHIDGFYGMSLFADRVTVSGGLFCRLGFRSKGEIRLLDSIIVGGIDMSGANLENPGKAALSAYRLKVEGSFSCTGDFRCAGEVSLQGVHVSGQMAFDGAQIANPGETALDVSHIVVEGVLSLQRGFHAEGKVSLYSARVVKQVVFDGAHLLNPGKTVFDATRLIAESGLFCDNGFRSEGKIILVAARVSGQLAFVGAHLSNEGGVVLAADGLIVDGPTLMNDGFRAEGEVNLKSSQFSSTLSFRRAIILNPGGIALTITRIRADLLRLDECEIKGAVEATFAQVRIIQDSPSCWPDRLVLDGFTYDDLQPYAQAGGQSGRLAWLELDEPGYRPQPYEQLAAQYRRLGHDEEARRVLIAKQRRRREDLDISGKFFGFMLDVIVGYGYRPGRAFAWLVALLTFGSIYFTFHRPVPIDPSRHPNYQPVLYAADLVIPIINLGQSAAWSPMGASQWVATALVIGGWILTTAVVAGVTRVLARA